MHPLSERILDGDRRALARGLSIVEDRRNGYLEILADLYRKGGSARVIGVTGPPGAGKSTLVDKLIGAYRAEGKRVAVAAVDPSSAFSGGAILGDRIRMQDRAMDEGVFIRSMAARGHMGGLALATGDVLAVLDAAGFDVILVETVGVGQDEVDIVKEAQTVLVLLVPGMGDDIQAIKAGIMEIADVFVINKADREGVDRVERELNYTLALAGESLAWRPPVVRTVASTGEGVPELLQAVAAHQKHLSEDKASSVRLRLKFSEKFREILAERFLMRLRENCLTPEAEAALAEAFVRRETDPYTAAGKILDQVQCGSGRTASLHLDHLGLAVMSLAEAKRFYEDLGLSCSGEESVEEQKVRAAFMPLGGTRLELLESTDPQGPIGKFLEKRGPGLHHVCIEVPDVQEALGSLEAKGYALIDRSPRTGAGGHKVAFVHPKSTGGVLIELTEKK